MHVLVIAMAILLTSCSSVSVTELMYRQEKSAQLAGTHYKGLYISLIEPSEKITYLYVQNDFKTRFSHNPRWRFAQAGSIEEFKAVLEDHLKNEDYDELLIFGHGHPFLPGLLVGSEHLSSGDVKDLRLRGSLAKGARIYLYSCRIAQRSVFQWGRPFVEVLGSTLLKHGGTVVGATRIVNVYPEDIPTEVKTSLNLWDLAVNLATFVLFYPTAELANWAPWDRARIREIKIEI